jgi:hypothetical protein
MCEPEMHAQAAASLTSAKVNPMVLIHRNTESLAMGAQAGDVNSIHALSQTVFIRVGVPANLAYSMHYVQRLAQAETDYRNGAHAPVHIADIVRANNDLVRILGAPQWAMTSQTEVTRLRMGLFARYPRLFANQVPAKIQGHFQILSENLSPIEAVFLSTSLLYQKEFNPDYQLTSTERADSANNPYPASLYQARTQAFVQMLYGRAQSVSLSAVRQAAEIWMDDLNISSSLRPEFQSILYVSPTIVGKGGQK